VWSTSHSKLIRRDHALSVERQKPMWGQHHIPGSYDEITHFLWKDKGQRGVNIPFQAHTTRPRTRCGKTTADMGSASHPMLIRRDHAQTVEAQRPTWGQQPILSSYDEITHNLWKDKGRRQVSMPSQEITHCLWKDKDRRGVSIPLQAHTTRSRTSCGKTKADVGSASHQRFIRRDHAQSDKGQRGSTSHCRLIQRDHAQSVEGQRPKWVNILCPLALLALVPASLTPLVFVLADLAPPALVLALLVLVLAGLASLALVLDGRLHSRSFLLTWSRWRSFSLAWTRGRSVVALPGLAPLAHVLTGPALPATVLATCTPRHTFLPVCTRSLPLVLACAYPRSPALVYA